MDNEDMKPKSLLPEIHLQILREIIGEDQEYLVKLEALIDTLEPPTYEEQDAF